MGINLEFYNELDNRFQRENIIIEVGKDFDYSRVIGFKLFETGDKLLVYIENGKYCGKFE